MKKFTLLFVLVIASAIGFAQEVVVPKQIKDLSWLIGTWEGSTTYNMGGVEMVSKGTVTYSQFGSFLKMVIKSDTNGVVYIDEAYISWNDEKKRYDMTTFTNWADTPRIEHATYKDGVFLSTSEPWTTPGMGTMSSKITMTKKSENQFDINFAFKMGEEWTDAGKGSFKKK